MSCYHTSPSPPPPKRFKTGASRRHNKDFSHEKKTLTKVPYGWVLTYRNRAQLVKVLTRKAKAQLPQDVLNVKFVTHDSTTGDDFSTSTDFSVEYHDVGAFEDFLKYLRHYEKAFKFGNIQDEKWKGIISFLVKSNFKYGKLMNGVDCWNYTESEEDLNELSEDQTHYISTFITAMLSDMINGQGKDWILELATLLTKFAGYSKYYIKHKSPPVHDGTNTEVEVVSSELLYNLGYSEISSVASSSDDGSCDSERRERRHVCPDVYSMLPSFPGMFPLVVELKPANRDSGAASQIFKQMLSKLFFQDIVFGIIITPLIYELLVVIKKNNEIISLRTKQYFTSLKDDEGEGDCNIPVVKLDVESMDRLCNFMYSVIEWGVKTNCLLQIENTCTSSQAEKTSTFGNTS